jgi:chorismate dehydratase
VLDPASRTSVALLKVLLERRHGLRPAYEVASEPGPDPRDHPDAIVLAIGDRAMARRRGFSGGVLDLGAEWKAWTGLPFVYARWTARTGLSEATRDALARMLDSAAQRGMLRRDELAAEHGPLHGLSAGEARRYLGSSIRYTLGERADLGIARFAAELRALEGAA